MSGPFLRHLKNLFVGRAHNLNDQRLFHKVSLIAIFAWVGLGADGLSSTCYGPEESFLVLQGHLHLGIFVALATALTILVISASYTQVIELFSGGGGGYLVASKLLSPTLGMVSGCALLIDYVLTIALSISSGVDAVFSSLPLAWEKYKLVAAIAGVLLLILMNLRGVRESVMPLVPIFGVFLITHAMVIVGTLFVHLPHMAEAARATSSGIQHARSSLGMAGMLFLLLRAYSMSAGTYTGIEAVSNAIPLLREPRVQTAKRTMRYMSWSLAITAVGIMLAYVLFQVRPQDGKTLNAVMLQTLSASWNPRLAAMFITITLISEAALLFIAAQSGFMGGPRVLANMALDRWVPTKFAILSDRLVTQNGMVLMGLGALATILLTGASVHFLIVLYSMNVFITFALSQTGMARHWWNHRPDGRFLVGKFMVNGVGLILTTFILLSICYFKFHSGGWITLVITGSLAVLFYRTRRYYQGVSRHLGRLDVLVSEAERFVSRPAPTPSVICDPAARTAVLLVDGFNGLGLHTLYAVIRMFGSSFRNFVFVQVGIIDAGNFKGKEEIDRLHTHVDEQLTRYRSYMQLQGHFADTYSAVGVDVAEEIARLAPEIVKQYPKTVFFGGQLTFKEETMMSRLLHNHIVFSIQRRLHYLGVPFVILPIRV